MCDATQYVNTWTVLTGEIKHVANLGIFSETMWKKQKSKHKRLVHDKGNETGAVPLFELGVDDSVGEALTTDSDALEYTVTLQLMKDQFSIHHTCKSLQLIIHCCW